MSISSILLRANGPPRLRCQPRERERQAQWWRTGYKLRAVKAIQKIRKAFSQRTRLTIRQATHGQHSRRCSRRAMAPAGLQSKVCFSSPAAQLMRASEQLRRTNPTDRGLVTVFRGFGCSFEVAQQKQRLHTYGASLRKEPSSSRATTGKRLFCDANLTSCSRPRESIIFPTRLAERHSIASV